MSVFTGSVHDVHGDFLYIIECFGPNNRKNDANEKEDQSRHQNASVIMLFGIGKLALPVIGISFLLCSAHRNKGEHHISQNKSDADKCALAADIHHARKKRHQDARDKERIRKDLDIDRKAVCKKALGPNHEECDHHLNGNTNPIIS